MSRTENELEYRIERGLMRLKGSFSKEEMDKIAHEVRMLSDEYRAVTGKHYVVKAARIEYSYP